MIGRHTYGREGYIDPERSATQRHGCCQGGAVLRMICISNAWSPILWCYLRCILAGEVLMDGGPKVGNDGNEETGCVWYCSRSCSRARQITARCEVGIRCLAWQMDGIVACLGWPATI